MAKEKDHACISNIQKMFLGQKDSKGRLVTEAILDTSMCFDREKNSIDIVTYSNIELTIEGQKKKIKQIVAHNYCPFCGMKMNRKA